MAKTYTTVADKSVGDVFTEAMWDDYIKTNVNNLIVPPMCRVRHGSNQSASNASTTALAFDTEDYDTDGMHDTVTNNGRITIQTAGVYLVRLQVVWATNASGYRFQTIRLNGSTTIAYAGTDAATWSAVASPGILAETEYNFAAADYIEALVQQSSGGALNVSAVASYSPVFSARWVGKSS